MSVGHCNSLAGNTHSRRLNQTARLPLFVEILCFSFCETFESFSGECSRVREDDTRARVKLVSSTSCGRWHSLGRVAPASSKLAEIFISSNQVRARIWRPSLSSISNHQQSDSARAQQQGRDQNSPESGRFDEIKSTPWPSESRKPL